MDNKEVVSPPADRKGQKRKLAESGMDEPQGEAASAKAVAPEVQEHVKVLKAAMTWKQEDRLAAKKAAHAIAELAKHGM